MTNPPPNNSESSRSGTLGFDELIAILVAFATIGGILFWSLSRKPDGGWNLNWLPNSGAILSSQQKEKPQIVIEQGNTDKSQNKSPVAPLLPQVDRNTTPKSGSSPAQLGPLPIFGIAPSLPDGVKLGSVLPGILEPSGLVTSPTESKQQTPPGAGTTEKPIVQGTDNAIVQTSPYPAIPTPNDKKTQTIVTAPKEFTDVAATSWERPFVDALSSRGMIDGYKDNSFKPEQPVSRAEFAALLNQAFKKEQTPRKLEFTDVPADFWANSAIEEAISTKFLSGYPDKTFKPARKIPRVEALVAIVSGLNLQAPSSPQNVLKIYEDADKIPEYATEKIAIATANNLVVDSSGKLKTFEPNREATRAEVVAMLHQALVQTDKLQPISSDKIVRYQP